MKELIWKKLETDRLVLDLINKKEVPENILSLEEVYFWYGYEIEKPYNPLKKDEDLWNWHLIQKKSKELMGYIGIGGIKEKLGIFNFHYIIAEEFKNQGYMTEAGRKILDFAFNELELRMGFANIHEFNIPSRKLVERLGFQVKSYGNNVPHYILGDGKDMIYQLKKIDWKNQNGK